MKKILFSLVFGFFLFFITGIAYGIIENPLAHDSLAGIIEALIIFVRNIALGVAPIVLVIAGFYFLASGGSPEKVQKAKNIVTYTVIGLVIVLMAQGLVIIIKNLLGVEGG